METIACDYCRSESAEVVLCQRDLLMNATSEEFTIVRCRGCGLLYLNPRPSADEIGRYYPAEYYPAPISKPGSDRTQQKETLSAKIKRWIREDHYGYPSQTPPGLWRSVRTALLWPEKTRREFHGRHVMPWVGRGRLLDVGCGSGGNLALFQAQGWEVYGIEISQLAAAQARVRVGDTIHTGQLDSAPFENEFFDAVFMSHSLEHLFSPTDAVNHVWRLLKPNGLAVMTVPNVDSMEARLFGRWWFHWDPPRHLYHFDRRTLQGLLERAGFSVLRLRSGVGSTFFLASLERAWAQRFRRRLPMRRLVEKVMAKPLCLMAGRLGYGTEITVCAVKGGTGAG